MVKKVKAHTTEDDVLEGLIELRHHRGNTVADALAVHARKVAEARAPTASFRNICVQTCQWYRWCRRVIAHWVEDTKAEDRAEGGDARARRTGPGIPWRRAAALRHRVWKTGGGSVMCQRCGLTRPMKALATFRRQACAGCPSGRILARAHADAALRSQVMSFSDYDMKARGATPFEEADERVLSQVPEPAIAESEREEHWEGDEPFGHLSAEPSEIGGQSPVRSEALPEESTAAGFRAHRLRKHGSTAWCDVCGRWAIARVGLGLSGNCTGVLGSYSARRERLRAGKHPLTGRPL